VCIHHSNTVNDKISDPEKTAKGHVFCITKMKLWSLRSAYNNYEIIVVTASLGVTRRRSLCRHVLLKAVWLNTTIGGSNTPSHAAVRHL